jgi:hypothetical protein
MLGADVITPVPLVLMTPGSPRRSCVFSTRRSMTWRPTARWTYTRNPSGPRSTRWVREGECRLPTIGVAIARPYMIEGVM